MAAAPAVEDRPPPPDEARPRRTLPGWLPLLLYPVLALFSFPTLGHLLFGKDALVYALDTFELQPSGSTADWLAHGFTLWNTHLTAGNALFAQQWYSPIGFDVPITALAGPFAAYAVVAWLLPAVAGVGMHLFLRDALRLDIVAVVAGAVLYLFSYWHFSIGLAAAALPLLLWLFEGALRADRRRWRYVVACVAAIGVVLYQGLAQVALLLGVVELLWVVVRTPGRALLPGRLAVFGGIWLLGLALYAPSLVTQLVMLPISNRTTWPHAVFPTHTVGALGAGLRSYDAIAIGVPVRGGIGESAGRFGTWFLGALGLPLLVLGIVRGGHDRTRIFLLSLLLLVPAWEIVRLPVAAALDRLPLLGSLQLDRVRHVIPFVLAAGAALGVDLLSGPVLRGRPVPALARWRVALVAVSVVPIAVAAVLAVRAVVRRRHELVHLAAPALGWALLAVALVGGLIALAALVWLLVRRPVAARRTATLVALGFLVALGAERAVYAWGERLTDVAGYQGSWNQSLGDTPAKQFLAAQPGIDTERVLTFGGRPNQLAPIGMLEVGGYSSMYPDTYHRFFGTLIAPSLVGDAFHTRYYWHWGNRAVTFGPEVDPELVALAGARWLLVHDGSVPTVPGIIERFRSGSDVVYEVPSVLPRAFVAGALDRLPDDGALLAAIAGADAATLGATAYVAPQVRDHALDAVGSLPSTATQPAGSARIVRYTPDEVEVDVSATGPGVLVLTDVAAPGWQADRDGSRVPIATVDETFRGVAVDAATRTVVFRYRPGFTYLGFVAAGLAVLVTALLAALLRRRDRAAPPGRSGPSPEHR